MSAGAGAIPVVVEDEPMKEPSRGILWTTLGFVLLLAAVALGGLFVHELGHGITAQALGGRFNALYVYPGIQVWPEPGQPYDKEWGTAVGMADTDPGQNWPRWKHGLEWLMGSGANLVLAMMALLSLWVFRPKGWLSRLLVAESLLYVDILLYTILPEWFGLPHWFFFGGDFPEPLVGAEWMGVPRGPFITLVLVISALMTAGLIAYVWPGRAPERWPRLADQG
jgi:hypothetical protein